jgi:hypothetical protein
MQRALRNLILVSFAAAITRTNGDSKGARRIDDLYAPLVALINTLLVDISQQIRSARVSCTIEAFSDSDCYRRCCLHWSA